MASPLRTETAPRKLLDEFQELLSCVRAVSFDVFDTTLQRVVHPKEVFALVETAAITRFGPGLRGFADSRIQAEQEARRRLRKRAGHGEVDLEAIYTELRRLRPKWALQTEALQETEMATEEHCVRAHPLGRMLWQQAVDAGRTVCFLSDMYLGGQRIESLLRIAGYDDPVVLCSSDYGRNKSNGTLYAVAAEQLKLRPGDILHIGDHLESDQAQARRCGLHTLAFPAAPLPPREAKHFRSVSRESNAVSVSTGLTRRGSELNVEKNEAPDAAAASNDTVGYRIGYNVLGPLAYGLCRWLVEQVESDENDLLLCLGRDGHLPQQILKRWQTHYGCLPETRIVYTPSSRRAATLALAADGVHPLVYTTLGRHRRSVPLRDYLERIGLKPEAHFDAARASGFHSLDQIVHRSSDRPKMKRFIKLLEAPLRQLGTPEKTSLLKALAAQGFDQAKRPAIFDLGWRGTQQACLQAIFPQSPPLKGYYLSISETFAREGTTAGYLVNNGAPNRLRGLLEGATPVIELLFSSPEPTLLHYRSEEDKSVPVFDKVNPNAAAIRQLQAGALAFVDDFTAFHHGPTAPLPKEAAIRPFTQLTLHPDAEQTTFLASLLFSDALGKEDGIALTNIKPPPLSGYLLNYQRFFEAYSATCWRAHFISEMSLSAKCWVWPRSPSFRRIWRAMRRFGKNID